MSSRLPERCREAGRPSAWSREILETLTSSPTANSYNRLGVLFAQDKEIDCAIASFGEALRLEPGAWEARYNLGLALISHHDYTRAVEELQLAIREKPDSSSAYNALGVAHRSLGQLAAASSEYKRAIDLNPRFAEASLNFAEIAIEEKRYTAATLCLKEALARSPAPQDAELLQRDLALAYSKNHDFENAAIVFRKLTASHPDSAELRFNLANCYAHSEEYAKAAVEYREVLGLEPKNDIARLSLGKALLAQNSTSESLPYLKEYTLNQPQDPEGYEIEGRAYRRLGRFAEAVATLRRAVALNANSYAARYDLGFCLAQLGESDEAIAQFREAARLQPNSPETAYQLGRLLSKKEGAKAGQNDFQKFQQGKEESQRLFRANGLNQQGNKLLGEGKPREAVEAYLEALRLNPNDALMHYNLSLAYAKLGNRTADEKELLKAVQLDPKMAKAHNQLGLRYLEDGKAAEAERELKAALDINPQFAEAENNLGVLYARQGKYDQAEDLIRKAQEDDPQYAQAFLNLGLILGGQGRLKEAEQELQNALKISPDDLSIQTALGMTEAKLDHGKQAVEIFRTVVRMQPSSAEAHLNLGIALADNYDVPGALEQFTEAARLDPGSAVARYNKARIFYDLSKNRDARAELELACKLNPDYPAALYLWALVERELNDLQKSTELLERMVKLTPKNANGQSLFGQNLLQLGRTDEAIEHLRMAVEADPENSRALYNLARTLEKSGKPDAKVYVARLNELENRRQLSDRVAQLGNYGLEAFNAHNWTQAIGDFKEALQICDGCRFSADLHRNLGLIYCHKGDIEEGKRELGAALKLRPDDPDVRKALEILDSLQRKPAPRN